MVGSNGRRRPPTGQFAHANLHCRPQRRELVDGTCFLPNERPATGIGQLKCRHVRSVALADLAGLLGNTRAGKDALVHARVHASISARAGVTWAMPASGEAGSTSYLNVRDAGEGVSSDAVARGSIGVVCADRSGVVFLTMKC